MTSISPALTVWQRVAALGARIQLAGDGAALPYRVPIVKQDYHYAQRVRPFLNGVIVTAELESSATCGLASAEAILQYWNWSRAHVHEWNTVAQAATNAKLMGRWNPRSPSLSINDPMVLSAVFVQNGLNAHIETNHANIQPMLRRWVGNGETIMVAGLLDGRSLDQAHWRVVEAVDTFGVHLMDPLPKQPTHQHVPWDVFLVQYHHALNRGGLAIRVNAGLLP